MAIKLLIGGSPCTYWSILQTPGRREVTNQGLGWELFKNYLIAKEKFKPDFFLYENNMSAAKRIKDMVANELGVGSDPNVQFTPINSSLVSAQNRSRFYVTNFGDIEQPADRDISFQDIKDTDYEYLKQFKVNRTPSREKMWNNGKGKTTTLQSCANITHAKKSFTLTTKQDRAPNAGLVEFEDFCRYLTTHELERLQTMPVGYTKVLTKNQAEKALGNGWTAEVIIHLLSHALRSVSRDTEIIVLSLSMTVLPLVDIVLRRWDLQISNITLTRLINTLSSVPWTITPILFSVGTLSVFVKTIGSHRNHAQNGSMSFWEVASK